MTDQLRIDASTTCNDRAEASAGATGSPTDIPALTGLRFFASFAIVLHHGRAVFFDKDAFEPVNLAAAVPLFFCLSGFVLTLNSHKYNDKCAFYVARAARIYPAHLSTVALLFFLLWPEASRYLSTGESPHLAMNILLLQSMNPFKYYSLNFPSWSISVEIFLYMLFPFLLPILKTLDRRLTFLAWVAAVLVTSLIGYLMDIRIGGAVWLAYINPLVNVPTFALGITASLAYMTQGKVRYDTWFIHVTILLAIMILLAASGALVANRTDVGSLYLSYSAAAPLFALLLYSLATFEGPITRFLARPTVVYLGEISFSLYLVHQIVFRYWDTHRLLDGHPPILRWAVAVAMALAISAVNYHVIEKPLRRFILARWK